MSVNHLVKYLFHRHYDLFIVSGAYQCFKRDQLRLIQHSCTPGTSEAVYQDLLLEVQLEVCTCNKFYSTSDVSLKLKCSLY